MRIILHVDLDSFFPSVEVRAHPELKDLPVIVGADPKEGKGRGIVSSASYEARKYGVRSAMPISRAWKLCPNCIYLRPHFDLYVMASGAIMKILKSHADKFEQAGIDEAFLDISNRVKDFEEAIGFAKKLMEEILDKEGLTCSIGVAPNKMVAKIASDYRKPSGLTAVKEEEVRQFLYPLKVRALPGVGPKTERRLKELKIETISDLAKANPEVLTRLFGVWGARLHEYARGIDYSEVKEEYETKSIGREVTFERDIDDENLILSEFPAALLRLGWSGNRLKEGCTLSIFMIEVRKASHCAYKIRYHMVFAIKYRRKLLHDSDRINYIKLICSEIGERYWFDFDAIGTDGDHVHVFVGASPRYSPSKVMQIIKSITAKEFFKKFPQVRKQLWGGEFWGDGGYIGTVGDGVMADVIRNYIEMQGTPEEKEGYTQMNLMDFS